MNFLELFKKDRAKGIEILKKDPAKRIELLEADKTEKQNEFATKKEEVRKLSREVRFGDESLRPKLESAQAQLLSLERDLKQLDSDIADEREDQKERLEKEAHQKYLADVKKVRTELMPKGVEKYRKAEELIKEALKTWHEGNEVLKEMYRVGLENDGSWDVIENDRLFNYFRLALRKNGIEYDKRFKQVATTFDPEHSLLSLEDHMRNTFAWYLKMHGGL